MPREKESYRLNLEQILNFTDGEYMLNVKQVCKFTGMSFQTVKKRFIFDKFNKISAGKLASELS